MLVLLAMVVPLNVGGWGPREGVAAWAFAAAGWGAAQGVAAATAYGCWRSPQRFPEPRCSSATPSPAARRGSSRRRPSTRIADGRPPPVADRPYTLLSCSVSLDGYLAGAGQQRLLLSNDDDLDRVDAVRATCDAILVGAATVRNDNPRLLVRAAARRAERVAEGCRRRPPRSR